MEPNLHHINSSITRRSCADSCLNSCVFTASCAKRGKRNLSTVLLDFQHASRWKQFFSCNFRIAKFRIPSYFWPSFQSAKRPKVTALPDIIHPSSAAVPPHFHFHLTQKFHRFRDISWNCRPVASFFVLRASSWVAASVGNNLRQRTKLFFSLEECLRSSSFWSPEVSRKHFFNGSFHTLQYFDAHQAP